MGRRRGAVRSDVSDYAGNRVCLWRNSVCGCPWEKQTTGLACDELTEQSSCWALGVRFGLFAIYAAPLVVAGQGLVYESLRMAAIRKATGDVGCRSRFNAFFR